RAAVGEEMLGRARDAAGLERPARLDRPLQAKGQGTGVAPGDLRVLAEALVAAAPAVVARHREGGAEGPVGAGDGHLKRGRLADASDQVGIARGAEADVVREDGGADDVVV